MDTLKALLQKARVAGLRIHVETDRLDLRGPRRLAPLVEELAGRKAEVLAALGAESALRETEAPFAILPAGADAEHPPAGWTYLREGRLAGLWIGPDGALGTSGRARVPFEVGPRAEGPDPGSRRSSGRGDSGFATERRESAR